MKNPFEPPLAVALNALEGLILRGRGRGGRGLVPATVTLARKLARREALDETDARQLRAWFARFRVNTAFQRARQDAKSPASVAWLLHGGDEAVAWLDEIEFHLLKIPSKGDL